MGNTNKMKNRTAEVEELMVAKRENPFLCVFTMGWSWETDRVAMVAAGVRCVSTGTVEAAERAMWARVWKNLAAAKEALKVEVFSLGESGVGVTQKGALAVVEEITAVVQEEEKLVPQERV